MKIDLVKLVEKVYKLEGEPKNVNKVFALICLQAFEEQLILSGVSNRRGLLIADMVKMIEGYTDEEINIVCDQRNEIYGSNL